VNAKIGVQDCELFEKRYYILIFLSCAKIILSLFFLMGGLFFLMGGLFIEKPFRD